MFRVTTNWVLAFVDQRLYYTLHMIENMFLFLNKIISIFAARTKLANILFMKELSRRLQAAGLNGILANAVNPG